MSRFTCQSRLKIVNCVIKAVDIGTVKQLSDWKEVYSDFQ